MQQSCSLRSLWIALQSQAQSPVVSLSQTRNPTMIVQSPQLSSLRLSPFCGNHGGPPPGRGVKPEEVYTQRYYTGLLSNEKKENILAEDDYEGLQHQSADANPFDAKVVSNWREDHATLPVPPRPDPKGKKKAKRS
jgi:hypothetical protein